MVKTKLALASIFLSLALFFVFVYNSAMQSEHKIFDKIQNDKIKLYRQIFQNFNDNLVHLHHIKTKKELFQLLADTKNRQILTRSLALVNTTNTKYIYILQKDKRGRFRFLLDASREDKANFYQKFDVHNSKYKLIYTIKKPQIIKQKDIRSLYLTYLYPLMADKKVIAIGSVDIAIGIKNEIAKILAPTQLLFKILTLFVFLVVALTLFQIFYYFFSRKKLFTDPLTKLLNRNYLNEIKSSLHLQDYAVAMLDLDKFKIVNDTYGHKAGDYVLQKSAEIFQKSVRSNDRVIRYGGEEFLLFIYTRGDTKMALEVCERVRKSIEDYDFIYGGEEILVTISIGLNTTPSEEKNLTNAIKTSDECLYTSKRDGRNRVSSNLTQENINAMHSDAKDIHFVKKALLEERVVCFYQPIYDYKKGEIIKYESLVRIIDEDGTIISPFKFLPNIEHTNIHFKITKEILRISFQTALEHKQSLTVNLNYYDFINKDIEQIIIENFAKHKELASYITFEVLESDEIENIELFIEKIRALHKLGATISIDDFGSGYSNFKTVLDIESDFLKIDGTLVKDIDKDEKGYRVVKNIIRFARDANMKTIAEYVHSKKVYDKLVELDVDYMQGYYISEPTPTLLKEIHK